MDTPAALRLLDGFTAIRPIVVENVLNEFIDADVLPHGKI
jgi:hypothetical protein